MSSLLRQITPVRQSLFKEIPFPSAQNNSELRASKTQGTFFFPDHAVLGQNPFLSVRSVAKSTPFSLQNTATLPRSQMWERRPNS
ncbi:hypothetical protein TNCV_3350611 [Trichonephila clavipes]|nr:hypothetical protein TNCV_3350611 [Trichonephila clavipes]